MTQDLNRIRAFLQVYEAGGFSAAARQHGRSKALLSKYVTDLEDFLGVRLMNRTTRKLALTEAGETYYRDVSQLVGQLDELDAAITDQTSEPRGLLRVSAPRNFGELLLAKPMFAFVTDHPAVSLDLRLEDRFVDLIEEGIDVALRVTALPDSALIARKIAQIRFAMVASPGFVAEYGEPQTPDDLKSLPCIIDTNARGQSSWRFEQDGKTHVVPVSGRVRVNSPQAAIEAAAEGLGIAVVPGFLADRLIAEGRLQPLLKCHNRAGASLSAVYPHRRHLAGKVRALIDHLVTYFAANPI